jgi:hypothetical protein
VIDGVDIKKARSKLHYALSDASKIGPAVGALAIFDISLYLFVSCCGVFPHPAAPLMLHKSRQVWK